MDPAAQHDLDEAMKLLWVRFLPQLQERVDTLESAYELLASGTLNTDQRAAANSAAHKLAGVLGTFGLTRGTLLAREAEILYSGEPEIDPSVAVRLGKITEQLKAMIANHR